MVKEKNQIIEAHYEINKCDQSHMYEASSITLLENLKKNNSNNLSLHSIQAIYCAVEAKNIELAEEIVDFIENKSKIYNSYNSIQKKLYEKHKLLLFKLKKRK